MDYVVYGAIGVIVLFWILSVVYVKLDVRDKQREQEENVRVLNNELKTRDDEIKALEEDMKELTRLKEVLDYVKVTYPVVGDLIEKEHLDTQAVKRNEEYNDFLKAVDEFRPATEYEAEIQKLKDSLYVEKMDGEYLRVFRNIVIRNREKLEDEVTVNTCFNYDGKLKGEDGKDAGFDIDIDILKGDVKKYAHKRDQY